MRKKVAGTSERPRLAVHRSTKHIRAQVIDDQTGNTLVSASSLDPEVRKLIKDGRVKALAEAAREAGLKF